MKPHLRDCDRPTGRRDAAGEVLVWTECGLEVHCNQAGMFGPVECGPCMAAQDALVRLVRSLAPRVRAFEWLSRR